MNKNDTFYKILLINKERGKKFKMPEGPCPPSPLPMFLMKHEYRLQKLNYPNLLVELLMLTYINPCVHGPSWIGLWNIFQPNPTFLGAEITNATHSSFKNHPIYHIGIIMELCWVVDLGHRPKNLGYHSIIYAHY